MKLLNVETNCDDNLIVISRSFDCLV